MSAAEDDEQARRASEASEEQDWIEIRRGESPVTTDMISDFLRDHDIRVLVRGNTKATRLPWQSEGNTVLRIAVHPGDVEKAREALEAFDAKAEPSAGKEEKEEEKYVQKRSALGAAFLGIVLPIGAGHFYARHGAAGTILCAGMIGSVLGMWFGGHWELARAWGILVAIDIVAARWAVKRFNEGRVPPESTQRGWALAAVVLAFGIAWFTGN